MRLLREDEMASKLGDGETANAFGSCVTSMLHTHFSKTKPSEILSCRCQVLFCANQTAVELSHNGAF